MIVMMCTAGSATHHAHMPVKTHEPNPYVSVYYSITDVCNSASANLCIIATRQSAYYSLTLVLISRKVACSLFASAITGSDFDKPAVMIDSVVVFSSAAAL